MAIVFVLKEYTRHEIRFKDSRKSESRLVSFRSQLGTPITVALWPQQVPRIHPYGYFYCLQLTLDTPSSISRAQLYIPRYRAYRLFLAQNHKKDKTGLYINLVHQAQKRISRGTLTRSLMELTFKHFHNSWELKNWYLVAKKKYC